MKIGVVTFFRVPNYGAMLQAYALRRVLEAMGHEVVFVAHPRLVATRLPWWRCLVSRSFKGAVAKLKNSVQFSMTGFAADCPQTRFCRTIAEVREATSDCEAFIVGSDQMWNPLWSSGDNLPLVMLDFAPEGKPRIAYAASFGTTVWRKDQDARRAGELLCKFAAISVREESGVSLVTELSGRADAVHMPDPTLLHTADFYRAIVGAGNVAIPNYTKPTVFHYMLDDWNDAASSHKAFEFVRAKMGLSNVESDRTAVRGWLSPLCKSLGVTAKVSVSMWLAKIAASDFVFTNSFHGTVFAVIFHRPFVSILLRGQMSGMNERTLSLLKKFGLESRAAYADDIAAIEAALVSPIDWERVDAVCAACAEEARRFLQKSVCKRDGI